MATRINGAQQIQPGSLTRLLYNTTTSGAAVITKVIAGNGISLTSTGIDSGTGDVTVTFSGTRTPVNDVNYSVTAKDNIVAFIAITATRSVTLPLASNYPNTRLLIIDESGSCSSSINISVVPNSTADTINGAASVVINAAYGYIELESNGSHFWTISDSSNLSPQQKSYVDTSFANVSPYFSDTPPSNPTQNPYWFDTSVGQLNVYYASSSSWIVANPFAGGAPFPVPPYFSDTPPASFTQNPYWFDTSVGQLNVYYPTTNTWITANPFTGGSNYLPLIGGALTGVVSTTSLISSSAQLQTSATVDTTGSTFSLANGSSIAIVKGSGLLVVTNQTTGDTGLFLLGGSTVSQLGSTTTGFVTSGSPSSGQVSVYCASGTYYIYNSYGSSISLSTFFVKTNANN